MHLTSARSGLRPRAPVRAFLRRRLSAECCLSCPGLHVLHARQSLHALRLLCLLCRNLMSVGACCCGAVLPLPRSSWSLRAPSLCTNLFWTLRCCLEHLHPSLLLLGHTFLLLSVLVQTAPSTSSAASGRCARILPSRGRVEGLVLLRAPSVGDPCARLLRSFSTWFRRVSDVAVASLRLLQAPLLSDSLSPLRCLTCVAVPT